MGKKNFWISKEKNKRTNKDRNDDNWKLEKDRNNFVFLGKNVWVKRERLSNKLAIPVIWWLKFQKKKLLFNSNEKKKEKMFKILM